MNSTSHQSAGGDEPTIAFDIVTLTARHDGWTAARQIAFIQILAETANVAAACRAVGMSRSAAYALYNRREAQSFRQAWDIAIEQGTRCLADAALERALNGVAHPIFYQGQQVGERRVFNEGMTMFLLRAHAPDRYGAWRDRVPLGRGQADGGAQLMAQALRRVAEDGLAMEAGTSIPAREPLPTLLLGADDDGGTAAQLHLLQYQLEALGRENDRLRERLTPRASDGAGSKGEAV